MAQISDAEALLSISDGNERLSLLSLADDLMLHVFHLITCSKTLYRAARVCKRWNQLVDRALHLFQHAFLSVSPTTIVDALKLAPPNERILIVRGSKLTGPLIMTHALHIKAEEDVILRGQLLLRSSVHDACHGGIVEGLKIEHFMESAVVVSGGQVTTKPRWELRNCEITSSRKRSRSSTAIQIFPGGHLSLVGVSIDSAVHAVCVDGTPGRLSAVDCTFTNTKEAIVTRGGGRLSVEDSTFRSNNTAFLLDEHVIGVSRRNLVADGSMFGKFLRPAGFRCHSNTYASPDENADEDEVDDVSCETCGLHTWMEGNWLLLCDKCDKAFHTRCLAPPHFTEVPRGNWYCPNCAGDAMAVELDEVEVEADIGVVADGVEYHSIDGFIISAQAAPSAV